MHFSAPSVQHGLASRGGQASNPALFTVAWESALWPPYTQELEKPSQGGACIGRNSQCSPKSVFSPSSRHTAGSPSQPPCSRMWPCDGVPGDRT